MAMSAEKLVEHFSALADPRCAGKVEHRLTDILVIAVCAVIACAESWDDIALSGRNKPGWLQSFLTLANGVPSHATFRRVFMLIDPDAFEMLWGGRWGDVTIVAGSNADGASHGTAAQRLEPVPHCPGPRQHDHCRHRDEPSKLARRRPCSRDRAPSAEEARTKRGGIAPVVDALACRGNPERPPDHTHRGRV